MAEQEAKNSIAACQIDASCDLIHVLANPKSGAGPNLQRVEQLRKTLQQRGFEVTISTDPQEFAASVADETNRQRLRCVVSAGGDGTAELVANLVPAGVPIAMFPLGTENLLGKYLSLRGEPEFVAQVIVDGHFVKCDAGMANDRLFLLMLGCGFDAEVVRRLHSERNGQIHHLSYAKPIFDAIRNYQYPSLKITCETKQGPVELSAHWVFVFNTPSYAIGLGISPEANPFDGLLNVTTFQGGSFWHGLFHLSAVMLGQHQNLSEFGEIKASKIRIESAGKVPYQIDGDPGGFLPVDIEVLPARLSLVVPAAWLESVAS